MGKFVYPFIKTKDEERLAKLPKSFTSKEAETYWGLGEHTTCRYLNDMKASGIISKKGKIWTKQDIDE